VDLQTLSAALARDRGVLSTQPGVWGSDVNAIFFITDRFHSASITSAENRWTGGNRGGYSNPKVDAILDRLTVTVSEADRLTFQRELLREQMGDVPVMPLYWGVQTWIARAGVRGIRDGNTWNMVEWDLS
jgi:ABC-type transport system substrate-binding protein